MKINKSVRCIEDNKDTILATSDTYEYARNLILQAIETLSTVDEELAKDAIADLSVVLLELK